MNESENLVPKRRFKEFTNTGTWGQRKSKEICTISTGKGNTQDKIDDGKYPFYVRSATIERSNDYLYDQEAVLTVGDGVGTGKVFHYVNGKYNLHQRVYRMFDFNNEVSAKYFYYYFSKKFYRRVMAMTAKTSVDSVRLEMIADMIIEFPSPKEQQKIVKLFESLDDAIALHQRKLDKTKSLKSAYLLEMFPAEGERKPKRRFAGFTDDWEQRKLEQLAQFNPKSSLPDKFEYVDLESVVGTEMISHRTETKENAPSRAQRLAIQGDVFYQTVRPYQKNNYLFDLPHNNYVFSTGYAQLRPFGDSYFLLSRLQDDKFVFNVLERSTGTSYPAINSSDLAQIEVGVPLVVEEQIKIGDFFKNLDNTIALHQRQVNNYKLLKNSLITEFWLLGHFRQIVFSSRTSIKIMMLF